MIFTRNGQVVTRMNWAAPTARADGSNYGAAEHAGYELGVSNPDDPADGFRPFVSVPAAYAVTSWALADLNMIEAGDYEVALRAVDTGGRTGAWSNPLLFNADLAAPAAPVGLSVS